MAVRLGLVFALAAAVSFLPDVFAVPRAGRRRTPAALALHTLAVWFIASCILLVTARVMFSACVAVGLVGLMVAVSNAKHESLREPFVFTDLSLFSQLFAHPRLYLPFLSLGKVLVIVAGALALIGGYLVEPRLAHWPLASAALAAMLLLFAGYGLAARLPLTLDVNEDQRTHGFFAVFVAYLLNGLKPATWSAFEQAREASPFATGAPSGHPDVIVIQSESFFDARRVCAGVVPSVYENFDVACRESVAYGELTIPAWGANTMRSEFSMLTGIAPGRLGYARFYPYAFLRRAYASLAGWFKRGGYRTSAIHPYYADFFGRQRVFPLLHFEQFLDIRYFDGAARAGAYVSDAAVTDAILDVLESSREQPVFIFAMTMENHGPLHLETVEPGESPAWHMLGEGAEWRDLTAYLRHVAHADAMIGRLLAQLRTRQRETVVCFYGDHVPALSTVFEQLGVAPERSDYFIWRNAGKMTAHRQDLRVEALGSLLVQAVQADESIGDMVSAAEQATQR